MKCISKTNKDEYQLENRMKTLLSNNVRTQKFQLHYLNTSDHRRNFLSRFMT